MKDTKEDKMKVAVLGYGTIGSGVVEIINNTNNAYLKDVEVIKVLDLPINNDKCSLIVNDINDIVKDASIDCVVETMGGLHPAYEFISAALENKKSVVTANKAVVAAYMNEFIEKAKLNGVNFLIEASTGGGIPWLAGLKKATRVDDINYFYGIFNGTTNYILDRMYNKGFDFAEVLKKAQDKGYAEADPSADIDGYDVKNKVTISSAMAWQAYVDMNDFLCYGIRNIVKNDIDFFKSMGKVVKYIGEARLSDNRYEAYVMPTLFDNSDVESNISTNFNICTLNGDTIGDLKFYGQGAGKLPTANAIVQDILDIKANTPDTDLNVNIKPVYDDEMSKNIYVTRTEDLVDSIHIEEKKTFNNVVYEFTKPITAKQFRELTKDWHDENAFVCKLANYGETK